MPLDALALRVISKESRQLFYAAKQYEPVISETKAGDVPVPVAGSGIAAAAAAERASAAGPDWPRPRPRARMDAMPDNATGIGSPIS